VLGSKSLSDAETSFIDSIRHTVDTSGKEVVEDDGKSRGRDT
jgi:hypothetical protein